MSLRSNRKPVHGQRSTSKKYVTSMSSKPEPVIWSHDTGQRIPCFDSCQLTLTWMSNIKDVRCKPRLHTSVGLLGGVWLPCCVTLSSSSSSYTPTIHAASHVDHEKRDARFSISMHSYGYGALLGGPLAVFTSFLAGTCSKQTLDHCLLVSLVLCH